PMVPEAHRSPNTNNRRATNPKRESQRGFHAYPDSKLVESAARKPPNAGKGRKKGVPNKTTAIMKDAITAVYADLQESVEDVDNANAHFLQWAKDNATEFYKLASKLIPIQLSGDPNAPLVHEIRRTIVDPANPDS